MASIQAAVLSPRVRTLYRRGGGMPVSGPPCCGGLLGVSLSPVPHGGVLRVQGYLAHKNNLPPYDPTVALCLGLYGGPRGGGRFLMREVPLYARVLGVRAAVSRFFITLKPGVD